MQDPVSPDLMKTLRDLESSFPGRRLDAIHKLADLGFSNDEIIRSLSSMIAKDEDPQVRQAAMQALQNPVHQEKIRAKPELLTVNIVSTMQEKEEADAEKNEAVIAAFLKRRSKERLLYGCYFLALILYVVISIILMSAYHLQREDLRCSWVILVLLAGLVMYLSWRNWRCPNCDSWLGGWKASVNPWWASAPLKCPHCGSKLLE